MSIPSIFQPNSRRAPRRLPCHLPLTNKLTGVLATVLVALLLPTTAAAESNTNQPHERSGIFVGLSSGASAINLDSIGTAEIGDTDHKSFVGKLTAGYWFSRHWGFSAEYLDLGEFQQDYSAGEFRGSAKSYGASLLVRLPLGTRWALIGKASVAHTKMRSRGDNSTLFADLHGSETQLVLPSFEVNYHFNPQFAVALELDFRGEAADDVDLGYVGLGIKASF